jgi:hypothetical protein
MPLVTLTPMALAGVPRDATNRVGRGVVCMADRIRSVIRRVWATPRLIRWRTPAGTLHIMPAQEQSLGLGCNKCAPEVSARSDEGGQCEPKASARSFDGGPGRVLYGEPSIPPLKAATPTGSDTHAALALRQ